MPSRSLDSGWDFGPVLDLIDSDSHGGPSLSNEQAAPIWVSQPSTLQEKTSRQSLRLGNFGKIFAELGISDVGPVPPVSPVEPDSEESSSSSDAIFASASASRKKISPAKKKAAAHADESLRITDMMLKEPIPDDGVPPPPTEPPESLAVAGLSKKQRKRARKKMLENELENEANPAAEPKDIGVDLPREDDTRPSLILHRDSTASKDAVHTESETKHHSHTPSRSNVGAKIQPAAPVQVTTTTVPRKHTQNPSAAALVPSVPLQPAASTAHTAVGHASTPVQILRRPSPQCHPLRQPDSEYFPLQSPSPAPVTQRSAIPSPMPTQKVLTPPRPVPNNYYTPQAPKTTVRAHGLVPRTVQPIAVKRSKRPVVPQPQVKQPQHSVVYPHSMRTPFTTPGKLTGPLTVRPKIDRNFHFFNQLLANFPGEVEWLVSPMQLCNESRTAQGIHVFVDASNILIGFQSAMKKYPVAPFDISFDSLALLMERRRPVAKRVFAGSHREANPLPYVTKLQQMSRAVGYENTIKEQVFICREETERKRFFKDVEKMGFQKAVEKSKRSSGSGSDSETGTAAPSTPSAPKWVEQGVDEILHLKMCQSIIDTEIPTTMVLATGDGAEAEHSDGFLAHVERALKKGWKIELVSWKQQTNGGYRNKKFRAKWGDQFRIIELDDYLEALIDTP